MTTRELVFRLLATPNLDREITIESVVERMDEMTARRLLSLLQFLSLTAEDEAVSEEALAVLVRLTIP